MNIIFLIGLSKKYNFHIEGPEDLTSSLDRVEFKIIKDKTKVLFVFRENTEGSVLRLLKEFSNSKNIFLYSNDENGKMLFKIALIWICSDETEISFCYDYHKTGLLKYKMSITCLDVEHHY